LEIVLSEFSRVLLHFATKWKQLTENDNGAFRHEEFVNYLATSIMTCAKWILSFLSTHKMEATHQKTEGGELWRASTAVCDELANSERKAVHMNIIMCRASYSG